MDIKPKGGGAVSFGGNVDLCTIPYGAFGPRGGAIAINARSSEPTRVALNRCA